jgi:hypothetical protein
VQSETTACDPLDCTFAVKRDLYPAYAPGTGTPEIGGYTPHEGQRMLRGLDLVGGDVVEVSPPFDMSGITRSWATLPQAGGSPRL